MTGSTIDQSDGQYGAHFWLKLAGRGQDRLPAGSFHMSGHDGQFVTVVPSKKLVIARLGLSRLRGAWDQTAFAAEIGSAIGD